MQINKIAIAGASGFIGRKLSEFYATRGINIIPIGRLLFNDSNRSKLQDAINGCDVVINLTGAPIVNKWSDDYKKELYDSRINTTRKLVKAINNLKFPPALFISTSAVGYYSSNYCNDEYDYKEGDDYLANLCRNWEKETNTLKSSVRLVIMRLGIVFSKDSGIFARMVMGKQLGVIPYLSSKKTIISWIDIDDLLNAINFIASNNRSKGIFNMVSPINITSYDFAKKASKYYNVPFVVNIPDCILKIIYGEASKLLTDSKCVKPKRLLEEGFMFSYAQLDDFLYKN